MGQLQDQKLHETPKHVNKPTTPHLLALKKYLLGPQLSLIVIFK